MPRPTARPGWAASPRRIVGLVSVAYYDSVAPLPATSADPAARAQRGAHLVVVRGRFEGKGDAHVFDSMSEMAGRRIQRSSSRVGRVRCEATSVITVCWRESDRLSVSVLHLDDATDAQVAAEVDEAWRSVG
jgi:hypothetical protein